MNTSESDMSVPVVLNRRLIWLRREVPCDIPQNIETWMALFNFKAQYEVKHGFDFMHGRKTQKISGAEIRPFLHDILTVRGSRMLDMAWSGDTLTIHLRIREESLNAMNAVLPDYIAELDGLATDALAEAGTKTANSATV